MGRLDGEVAIITGAGEGLGKAYAKGLAREGASVVVNDISTETATQTVQEIEKDGGEAVTCVGEVGSKETAEKLVETAVTKFGKIDIFINNAGLIKDALMVKMTEEQWDAVLNVHLKGTFLNSQAVVKHMIENKIRGHIINITSPAGIYGSIGQANYSAAKAGIIGLTKSNSRELARYGICVNVVCPIAKTSMTDSIPEKLREGIYNKISKTNTIQRVGEPEDVLPMMIFLSSKESYYITGQVVEVAGSVGFELV
ncbi:SDR family NAD(P)-dependent oxidoreductase [Thermodesulfobacteriota bacterium]